MNDFGLGSEAVQLAGHPVVEAGTQGDQQVGLLHGGDRGEVSVHAGHAQAQLVTVWKGASGHECGDHTDAGQLG